jgi:hypothetical protein
MNENLKFLLAVTCILPAAAAVIFFREIDKEYRTLIYILLLALVTEVLQKINHVSIKSAYVAVAIFNTFILANTIMHIVFFFNVGIITNKMVAFMYFICFSLAYAACGTYNRTLFSPYVSVAIFSYFMILQLSIKGIVMQTFKENAWAKDGLFLYCCINIIYSSFFVLTFTLRFFGIENSVINRPITDLHNYINAACYLLTLWPVLCLRNKMSYT